MYVRPSCELHLNLPKENEQQQIAAIYLLKCIHAVYLVGNTCHVAQRQLAGASKLTEQTLLGQTECMQHKVVFFKILLVRTYALLHVLRNY